MCVCVCVYVPWACMSMFGGVFLYHYNGIGVGEGSETISECKTDNKNGLLFLIFQLSH